MISQITMSGFLQNAKTPIRLSSTICRCLRPFNRKIASNTSQFRCLRTKKPAFPSSESNEIDFKNDPEVKGILQEISDDFRTENERKRPNITNSDEEVGNRKTSGRFILYDDKDAEVIRDVHEELQRETEEYEIDLTEEIVETVDTPFKGLNLQRGIRGVFDMEDLMEVLISENARDICVIEVPKEMSYADYMVLASGRSQRHISAVIEFVNKVYKRKKHDSDPYLLVQGKDSRNWKVLDMGNIVLHVLTPEIRSKYDIETLWSVGEKYDDHCQKPKDEELNRLTQQLKELEAMRPSDST